MPAEETAGWDYSKTEHRRRLLPLLQDRTNGFIEYKHQNVNAALRDLGEDWIRGYRPARNHQASLIIAVMRWLDWNPD